MQNLASHLPPIKAADQEKFLAGDFVRDCGGGYGCYTLPSLLQPGCRVPRGKSPGHSHLPSYATARHCRIEARPAVSSISGAIRVAGAGRPGLILSGNGAEPVTNPKQLSDVARRKTGRLKARGRTISARVLIAEPVNVGLEPPLSRPSSLISGAALDSREIWSARHARELLAKKLESAPAMG